MGKCSPMAAKTAKARKLSMLEAKAIQAVGDAADYERGREVRVYDHMSTYEEIDRRERFVRERRMLTPCEEWAVRRGYAANPFVHQRPAVKVCWCAGYREDGRKIMIRSLEEARTMLERGEIAKFWNSESHLYETRKVS